MNDVSTANGGYFRMPNSWLLLEISPGAKVLLCYLCSLARDHGTSYASYEQLGKIVGRAKSTVGGYVKELRQAGVINVEEQKMANGWNYRLKIKIIGWKQVVERMGSRKKPSKPAQNIVRSEQSVERNDPKGHKSTNNKINKHPDRFTSKIVRAITGPAPAVVWSAKDDQEWMKFRSHRTDPITEHGDLPRGELVQKLRSKVIELEQQTGLLDHQSMAQIIAMKTDNFVETHKIQATPDALQAFSKEVHNSCKSIPEVEAFFASLDEQWHPAWRKLSTKQQIVATYENAKISGYRPKGAAVANLTQYRGRLMDYEHIAKRALAKRP